MVPEVAVFDLGKVLVDFDYSIAARKFAARGTMPAAEVQKLIDHSPLLFRYETGQMSKEQFFAEVRAATGFRGEFAEFSRLFSDIFIPIEPMVELHAQLRERGIRTFIFSNTNELAVGHIRRSFPFFSKFDGYIFSYEHGAMKPDPKLYSVAERMIGSVGPKILYLDDRFENVEAGAARGWQVVQHKTPERTVATLRKLKLLPGKERRAE
jgi:HAD superfamily hydrolase (TIGR01509 family)